MTRIRFDNGEIHDTPWWVLLRRYYAGNRPLGRTRSALLAVKHFRMVRAVDVWPLPRARSFWVVWVERVDATEAKLRAAFTSEEAADRYISKHVSDDCRKANLPLDPSSDEDQS